MREGRNSERRTSHRGARRKGACRAATAWRWPTSFPSSARSGHPGHRLDVPRGAGARSGRDRPAEGLASVDEPRSPSPSVRPRCLPPFAAGAGARGSLHEAALPASHSRRPRRPKTTFSMGIASTPSIREGRWSFERTSAFCARRFTPDAGRVKRAGRARYGRELAFASVSRRPQRPNGFYDQRCSREMFRELRKAIYAKAWARSQQKNHASYQIFSPQSYPQAFPTSAGCARKRLQIRHLVRRWRTNS